MSNGTEAANGKDVVLGGGVSTIRQYLRPRLIDEMHLAIAPVLLGAGEHLLADIDARVVGDVCSEHVPTNTVPHVVIKKR